MHSMVHLETREKPSFGEAGLTCDLKPETSFWTRMLRSENSLSVRKPAAKFSNFGGYLPKIRHFLHHCDNGAPDNRSV
jgi:hypothetical protein